MGGGEGEKRGYFTGTIARRSQGGRKKKNTPHNREKEEKVAIVFNFGQKNTYI